ncbi:NhaP-type Na+/H+ or K+/H+ antiporter [Bradyrhizobium sp. USDA 4501]
MVNTEINGDGHLRRTAFWIALFVVAAAALVFAYTVLVVAQDFRPWQEVLEKHFAAIIGLPGAAAVAFVLVVFLRQTEDPIV